ncbi:phospholipid-translocating P-type ATPase [Microstroma glucosiphilum]|uniref:Phospholipid-transporting ATPase n=1 Tax=Pseudomicrostroma glucosiphilum TaxID=1684307 RepID=A0A316UDV2_9BASI|nr:phospholipid-translocating P-type ATPase [Pseudomicrostroma glucosiphilum]PWN23389.1 phospholipid-translocating P-type ATPase [Pseudomicrostroma glucosiphilum]
MANPFTRRKKARPATSGPQETKERSAFVQTLIRIKESGLDPEKLFAKRRPPPCPRSVYFNEPLPADYFDKKGKPLPRVTYATNQVLTAKYTVYNFIFKNLLEQFRRVANMFFLLLVILQFFPEFSTINPVVAMLPLLAVLALSALKDGYEDIKRHQSDRALNRQKVRVMTASGWVNPNVMEVKSSSVGAAFTAWKDRVFGGKKKQSAKLAERQHESSPLQQTISNPQQGTAVAPGSGTAPDARPLDGDLARVVSNRSHASTSAGRPSLGGRSRASTSGASMFEADGYEVNEEGRILHHGRLLSPDEEAKYKSKVAPRWKKKMWEDLAVGDFVLIKNNEPIPADVIICSTSEEEDACFVETKNLDGETNLKARTGVPELALQIRSASDCADAAFRADGEPQDTNMYRLNASVTLQNKVDQEGNPLRCPVTLNQVLLRGCILRNTAWVIGFVFMTGADSKIIANSGDTPSKRSKVEKQMNPMVYVNLTVLALVAIACAIADSQLEKHYFAQNAYWETGAIYSDDNPRINGLVAFGNALITFQNIVPISLYISIEAVRTVQAFFIYDDYDIWYEKTNRRTTARSWNLSDDLGQIEYIFSDKTGTLTQNLMLFQECSIGGVVYHGDEHRNGPNISMDGSMTEKEKALSTPTPSDENGSASDKDSRKRVKRSEQPAFTDSRLSAALKTPDTPHAVQLFQFWRCLALCHTALASENEDGLIEFKAQSPDEQALVQAAAEVGFIFLRRDRSTLSIQVPGVAEPEKYELLSVLEFTSARKRMSVILRRHSDSKILVLAKGADSIIFERSAAGQEDIKTNIDEHLEEFANKGLRTLCLAGKELTEDVYNEWAFRYHNASVSLDQREEKMEALASELELDFTLYGATAIEDKLQDGVPEAIADLKRAGIKVWVATGDKLETAIAIGYSTRLLVQDMNLIVIRGGEYGEPNSAYQQLKKATERFFGGSDVVGQMEHQPPGTHHENSSRFSLSRRNSQHSASRTSIGNASLVGEDNGSRSGGYALVIDGTALSHALTEDFSKDLLLNLSRQCRAVICCRVSPLQKALIVKLIKDGLGVMTLAIGDGANDVSMIQAAHVGIGIAGEEGLQAVNASDYAIAQFRFLKRLLLVHGHFSYYRSGVMINYFFYKQMIIVSSLFFFQIYAAWSTIYVLDYVYILLYNVVWTIAGCIGQGIFDRPLPDRILMEVPELYKASREGKYFGFIVFTWNMLEGIIQGVIVLFFFLYTYDTTSARGDGFNPGIYEFSTGMVLAITFAANIFLGLFVHAFSWWVFLSLAFGPIALSCFVPIYDSIKPSTTTPLGWGNNYYLYNAFYFYTGIVFCTVLCLLPSYLYRCWRETYYPSDLDIFRRLDKRNPNHDYVNDPRMPGKQQEAKLAAEAARAAGHGDSNAGHGGEGLEAPPTSIFAMHELHPTRSRASSRQYDMLTGTEGPSRGYSFSQEDLSGGRNRRMPTDAKKRHSTLRRLLPGSIRRSMRRNSKASKSSRPGSGLTEDEEEEENDPTAADGHTRIAEVAGEEEMVGEEEEDEAEVSRLAGRRTDPGPEDEDEDEDDEGVAAPTSQAAPALRSL